MITDFRYNRIHIRETYENYKGIKYDTVYRIAGA